MLSFFFSKHINVYAIFNDQSFNDMLTNNIISFDQLGPEVTCSNNADPDQLLQFVLSLLLTDSMDRDTIKIFHP